MNRLEPPGEMKGVLITHLCGHFFDEPSVMQEQFRRAIHFLTQEILVGARAEVPAEETADARFFQADPNCDFIERAKGSEFGVNQRLAAEEILSGRF